MPRHYIRFDPTFDQRKEHYTDGQYRAFVAVLCHAAFQPKRGTFRSLSYLKALLGRHGKYVDFLLKEDDIRLGFDDEGLEVVLVTGWILWQEGDYTVAERVARIRAKRRSGGARKRAARKSANGDANGGANSDANGGANGGTVTSRVSTVLSTSNTDTYTNTARRNASGSKEPPPSEEELIERYRDIRDNPDEPEWKREAAVEALKAKGVKE